MQNTGWLQMGELLIISRKLTSYVKLFVVVVIFNYFCVVVVVVPLSSQHCFVVCESCCHKMFFKTHIIIMQACK